MLFPGYGLILRLISRMKGTTMTMNHWTQLSVDFANQRDYLDQLFTVYPTVPETIRELDDAKWKDIERAFNSEEKVNLLKGLLSLGLFPIKDSYVAYLRRDPGSLARNPATVSRLYGRLKEMGLEEIWERCSEPKETNRQIGPLFRRWLQRETLGVKVLAEHEFLATSDNAILEGGDRQLKEFAIAHLGYKGEKGIDFLARFNRKYVAGEAKFLTDFGGHQNAQFEDAKNLLNDSTIKAVRVAILDGVLYIEKGDKKMFNYLKENPKHNILSCLVLREFLYSI